MTVYQLEDVRQNCRLIANSLRCLQDQLDTGKPDWGTIRGHLQLIEDRAVKSQQIALEISKSQSLQNIN